MIYRLALFLIKLGMRKVRDNGQWRHQLPAGAICNFHVGNKLQQGSANPPIPPPTTAPLWIAAKKVTCCCMFCCLGNTWELIVAQDEEKMPWKIVARVAKWEKENARERERQGGARQGAKVVAAAAAACNEVKIVLKHQFAARQQPRHSTLRCLRCGCASLAADNLMLADAR